MRITFGVGRVTVQEYNYVYYTRKVLKTAYFVRFKEFVVKVAILKELGTHKTRKFQ